MNPGETIQLHDGTATVLEREETGWTVRRHDDAVGLIEDEMKTLVAAVGNDLDGVTVVEH